MHNVGLYVYAVLFCFIVPCESAFNLTRYLYSVLRIIYTVEFQVQVLLKFGINNDKKKKIATMS